MKLFLEISFFFCIISLVSSRATISNPNEVSGKSCPENMIHLPESENSSDLVCDCKPRFLYHRESDSCHEAYKKGPCPPEHYFVLPSVEMSAKCERNPCFEDGLVQFQGSCARLGQNGPPCKDSEILLDVNEVNFELECKTPEPLLLFSSRLNVQKASIDCPRGSRRIYSGKCKHVFQ